MGRRMPASLPFFEQTIYWVVFLCGASYGIYHLYITSLETGHQLTYLANSAGFMKGFSDKQDQANFGWLFYEMVWSWKLPPMLLVYIIVSLALQCFRLPTKAKRCGYLLLSTLLVWYMTSWRILLFLLLTPLPFYLLSSVGSVTAVNILCIAVALAYNKYSTDLVDFLHVEGFLAYFEVIYVSSAFYLRCYFFALERSWSVNQHKFTELQQQTSFSSKEEEIKCDSKDTTSDNPREKSTPAERRNTLTVTGTDRHTSDLPSNPNLSSSTTNGATSCETKLSLYGWPVVTEVPGLLELYFYVFYVPIFFGGPPLNYKTFIEQCKHPVALTSARLRGILWKTTRIFFWACFIYVVQHFFYFSALGKNIKLMETVNKWTLATTAWLIGQFMTVKYVIIYGSMTEVAKFDGLDLPQQPACISTIYLYSDMWKSFDRGLYGCLKRYIFIPVGGTRAGFLRQELGMLASFLGMGVWHGGEFNNIIWALINFVEINLEMLGAFLEKNEIVQKQLMSKLSPSWDRRLRALLSYPLFILGTSSCQSFLASSAFAYLYATRICLQWDSFITLGVIAYSGMQVTKHLERLGCTKYA